MPRRSSAMSIDSLSVPGTETLMMCGARCGAPRPWITASGMRARIAVLEPIAQPLEALPLLLALGHRQLRGAREARRPAATFSVPGRRPRSCEPPCNSGSIERAAADEHRADALRRADLVARDRQEVERRSLRASIVDLAERLHGVGVEQRAGALGAPRELGDRLDRADLVVDPHHRATATSSPSKRVERRRRRRRRRSSWRRSALRLLPARPGAPRRAPPCARSASSRPRCVPRRAARARRRGWRCCRPRCRRR